MLLKIFEHGTGDPFKVDAYLLRDTDWTGEKRSKVEVLRGDPSMVSRVAADLSFVHKYTSGAFSFALEDNPNPKQIDEVLDCFEKTAWPGLEQDRYVWSAIKHEKDGKVDVHVYAARVDLLTGKSLNPAPPGWSKTFNKLCEHFNYKYGWARPDDPARKRSLSPGNEIYLYRKNLKEGMAREEPREVIHRFVTHKVETGQVENRQEIINELMDCGLEIPRQGKDYITVKDPETGKKYRMKGAFYERKFTVSDYAEIAGKTETGNKKDNAIDFAKSDSALKKLEQKITERAEYNRKTYPKPDPGNFQAISRRAKKSAKSGRPVFREYGQAVDEEPDNPDLSLSTFLERRLGSNSLLQEEYTGADDKTEGFNPDGTEPGERDLGLDLARKRTRTIHNPAPSVRGREVVYPQQSGSNRNNKEITYDRDITEAHQHILRLSEENGFLFQKAESASAGFKLAIGRARSANKKFAAACSELEQTSAVLANQDRRLDEVKIKMARELEEFKARNLVEIAEGYGYEIDQDRSTRSAISMRSGEHKIVVGQAEDGHGIYFSVDGQQEQGSVIDFVQNRLAASGQPSNLGYVRKELRNNNFSFSCRPRILDTPTIKPQKSSKNRLKVEAVIQSWGAIVSHPYLEDRGLDQVLSAPRFEGCVKMDSLGNVCFPHSDRQGFCGAEIKNYNFTGQIKHGTKGLWLSRFFRKDERLVVCESAIDCLSYHLLHGDNRTRYASFGGALSDKQRSLLQGLMRKAHGRGQNIVIAVDRDEQGDKYEQELVSLAPANATIKRHLPIFKDFNDDLRNRLHQNVALSRDKGLELGI